MHEHTSKECAISIVSVWRRPVASITYKNPVEITGGNCKRPIVSSNLLSMVWVTVSRWPWFRTLANFQGSKNIPLLQTYPQIRGVLLAFSISVWFKMHDTSLLAYSLNSQISSNGIKSPAVYNKIPGAREKRCTVFHEWSLFNENKQFRTFDSCAPEPGH